MKYRVMSTIAPACTVERGQYSKFEDAYKAYQSEESKYNLSFNRIEKKANGGWVEMTQTEIARKNLKTNKVNKIILQTDTDIYTFKLPQTVEVPNNMGHENTGLYILLHSLGIKPTVKHKK